MKKAIKILFIVLAIIVALSLVGLFAFLSFGRAGGEIGFDAVINRVEPEYNMAYATVTDQDAGFFSKKLPESIMFNTSDLDVELKAGDKIQGCYLSGTISGDSVRVVSVTIKGQNAVAPNKCLDEVAGNITFYEESVKEAQNSGGTVTVRLSRDLNEEQADKLKDILDDVDEWVDDHSVDRLAYYFDGDFELSDREHKYYFTYEYDVIYYDHYFAEIPAEDMQYIKDLGAECVELPGIETNSISFDDLAPGTETTFDTKIDVLTDNSELAYTLTYGRASISLEIGLRSEDGTELATEITGGDAKGVISNVPAGTYTVFLRNIEEVNQEVTETPNVTGALHFYIVELPGIERTDEPDEYPDTNIVPGFDLDEPYEPTEYTNYYDIEEQVELCKGTVDEKTKVTVKFQSTEGPSTFAVEVWHRASANDEWTKSESKSALVGDAPAFTVPPASEYVVMITATAGNKGNVTFFVSFS